MDEFLRTELEAHRFRTKFHGDDEWVFCNPLKGTPLDHKRYAQTLKRALREAGIEKKMRPFHDGRHTSITNGAAAGIPPTILMQRAGHSDFKTTQGYIDLAGTRFQQEAEQHSRRVFAHVKRDSGHKVGHKAIQD